MQSGHTFKTGRPGCPDITVVYKGKAVFFEIKTATGKQSKIQKQAQAEIEKAGGYYFVVHTPSVIAKHLEEITK